jgi:hypothetical protein
VKDSFFNPQGPRASNDRDLGITFIFSGQSKCTVREEQAQNMADDSDDKPEYYFVNHCSEVLSQLPPNIRSTLGAVITPKRALSTDLVRLIVEEAARYV